MDCDVPLRISVDTSARTAMVVAGVLPAHARRRGAVVLVHGRGPHSPWSPAASTLAGVVTACIDAGVAARWAALGRAPVTLGALAKIAAPTSDRRTLALNLGGADCELPRAWVGRHAVLVLPAVIDVARDRADATAQGPFAAALAALAVAAHARGPVDPTEVGAAVLAQVFAGFSWVLDASAVLFRRRRNNGHARVVTIDRVFAHGATGLDPEVLVERARVLDRWLQVRRAARGIALAGAKAADPWPVRISEPVGVDGPLWSPPVFRREARRP